MPLSLSVSNAFSELLSRIELNPTRVQLASQRYNAVKTLIEKALPGKDVTQIGSFQRKTKIRPVDLSDHLDIDVLVSFGPASKIARFPERGITPIEALKTVRDALSSDKTYRIMKPKTDAPTVVLEYADDFSMELVPAFADKTGLHSHEFCNCYLVGNASGNWVPADYDYDAAMISALNAICHGALVPSIKMIKAFIRGYNVKLSSFHIEILSSLIVPQAIAKWEVERLSWGYQHILAYFLSNVGYFMLGPASIPGSYSPPVDSRLSFTELQALGGIWMKFGSLAMSICKLGDTPQALDVWRQFFGNPFPS
ncbi:MAG: hypothetical protein M1379_12185 [Firmicutes bacterium]|nr:hypothetical protein [Bacillota bacterium]